MQKTLSLFRWVPSLYFLEGIPYALVMVVSPLLYKQFGMSNTQIAFYTSMLLLPWSLKPFFSPLLEQGMTKKQFTTFLQFTMGILLLILAIGFSWHGFIPLSILCFFLLAMNSALHDITADGLYLLNVDHNAQSYFVGFRTLFYQAARFITQGVLVVGLGLISRQLGIEMAWQGYLILLAIILIGISVYHFFVLPETETNLTKVPLNSRALITAYKKTVKSFRQLPSIGVIVPFLILYNFPEAQLLKIVPLFLLDQSKSHGLHLSLSAVGVAYGEVGVIAMMAGAMAASLIVARVELKKVFVPITLLTAITNGGYFFLSYFLSQKLLMVGLVLGVTQFAFGLSNTVFLIYLLRITAKKEYAMSLYAGGTALMAFGMFLGGSISGTLQYAFGYFGFFIYIVLAGCCVTLYTHRVKYCGL